MTTLTTQQLETVDRLRDRPFPAERGWSADGVYGGPGFLVADLLVSEDFWEDDGTRLMEADDQFEAERAAMVLLLSRRWGEPEVLDLTELFIRSVEGERLPEPMATLCGYVSLLYAWRPPDGRRRIAVGVGQHDRELPIQLLVTVWDEDVG
ncbi:MULTISPECIES: hypothetical protein [Streptomyces]|uniref:Uncharacterized protein n=1 Tax=Streptomyces lycii TaxID=2654337 RepID=A0ABQ7FM28_9ACTN|nr:MULTISPECIES: hypothetical protein [Streptomyces]KAF4409683.1 hypothetical protein GCU69_07700 [Streptomyces lycii]PGH46667.1 hypothetical protein CRI70_32825 [Streptomyces sp. Ru87]